MHGRRSHLHRSAGGRSSTPGGATLVRAAIDAWSRLDRALVLLGVPVNKRRELAGRNLAAVVSACQHHRPPTEASPLARP